MGQVFNFKDNRKADWKKNQTIKQSARYKKHVKTIIHENFHWLIILITGQLVKDQSWGSNLKDTGFDGKYRVQHQRSSQG